MVCDQRQQQIECARAELHQLAVGEQPEALEAKLGLNGIGVDSAPPA